MPSGEYGGPRSLNKRTWFKMFLLGFEAGVSKLGALFPATEAIPICDSHSFGTSQQSPPRHEGMHPGVGPAPCHLLLHAWVLLSLDSLSLSICSLRTLFMFFSFTRNNVSRTLRPCRNVSTSELYNRIETQTSFNINA
ncbi:hypothetical protein VNO77_20044 [Canavalia gladiata]|uniref:Uncharacterized protein n=1 Tax=Canavalia gladiata TaxID=3824 RepID=A0AAN9QM17_CANGL